MAILIKPKSNFASTKNQPGTTDAKISKTNSHMEREKKFEKGKLKNTTPGHKPGCKCKSCK